MYLKMNLPKLTAPPPPQKKKEKKITPPKKPTTTHPDKITSQLINAYLTISKTILLAIIEMIVCTMTIGALVIQKCLKLCCLGHFTCLDECMC